MLLLAKVSHGSIFFKKWRDGEGGRDGERKDQSYILGDRGKDT
jgi:hypothetical protein